MVSKSSQIHHIRIPQELNQKEILAAVGIGLYQIFLGSQPNDSFSDSVDKVKVRLAVSNKAQAFLDSLLESGEYDNKNEVLNQALSYVFENPRVRASTF